MNGVLTKREAVRKHRAMWNWIADYIEEKKEVQCIPTLKALYTSYHCDDVANDCYCCEYVVNTLKDRFTNCADCPIIWETDPDGICDGFYNPCLEAESWQEQANLARQIANLPEREDDPEFDIL